MGRGAVRQDAKDLLGFWFVPYLAHADVTYDILTVLLLFKVQALKWNCDLLGMVWLRLRPLEITMIAVSRQVGRDFQDFQELPPISSPCYPTPAGPSPAPTHSHRGQVVGPETLCGSPSQGLGRAAANSR